MSFDSIFFRRHRIGQKFFHEALVWRNLKHPFILPFIGIDCETFLSSLCMVSPWMEGGTVLKYLNDHGKACIDKLVGFPVQFRGCHTLNFEFQLLQIAQGLEYLHSQSIVHGDLRGVSCGID
jgi:serine/threonine-protein kinase TNNI3K